MIPFRYICTGDEGKGKTLIPYANKMLNFLNHRMSFNDIATDRLQPIILPDGTTINCSVNFGLSEARIHVPNVGVKLEENKECLCLPHFSIGIITKVIPDDPDAEFMQTGRFKYDVLICAKTLYLFYENAYDANFGMYYKGQIVLVTIGAEMDEWPSPLDCDRWCLAQKPRFDIIMISPIYVPGEMMEWKII
jgi:hypothetical protein